MQAAVVRDTSKEYRKATALPKDLVQRIAKLETDAYLAWVEARKESNFAKVRGCVSWRDLGVGGGAADWERVAAWSARL